MIKMQLFSWITDQAIGSWNLSKSNQVLQGAVEEI